MAKVMKNGYKLPKCIQGIFRAVSACSIPYEYIFSLFNALSLSLHVLFQWNVHRTEQVILLFMEH